LDNTSKSNYDFLHCLERLQSSQLFNEPKGIALTILLICEKKMPEFDIVILTDARYLNVDNQQVYTENVFLEDRLLQEALVAKGHRVTRTNWDNPNFDWESTKYAILRTTWDIYDDGKFDVFTQWLHKTKDKTKFINPYDTLTWNLDKHYLLDLQANDIRIPATIFIEKGNTKSLTYWVSKSGWKNPILKPAISGGGRHTYLLDNDDLNELNETFLALTKNESMLLQEFQHNIKTKGEITLMVFGGKYSHAVLKKVKPGDFRVQDDFGGTVHLYVPTKEEIAFAESVVAVCDPLPLQARVDFIWDNNEQLCVSELELIEPELWFRNDNNAASMLADVIDKACFIPNVPS
jgi:hypothetical protein